MKWVRCALASGVCVCKKIPSQESGWIRWQCAVCCIGNASLVVDRAHERPRHQPTKQTFTRTLTHAKQHDTPTSLGSRDCISFTMITGNISFQTCGIAHECYNASSCPSSLSFGCYGGTFTSVEFATFGTPITLPGQCKWCVCAQPSVAIDIHQSLALNLTRARC